MKRILTALLIATVVMPATSTGVVFAAHHGRGRDLHIGHNQGDTGHRKRGALA